MDGTLRDELVEYGRVLAGVGRHLLGLRGVKSVGVDAVLEPDGHGFAYVDIEVESGTALTWWLDITPMEPGWVLEGSVCANRGAGQVVVMDFDALHPGAGELHAELMRAVGELVHVPRMIEGEVGPAGLPHPAGPSAIPR